MERCWRLVLALSVAGCTTVNYDPLADAGAGDGSTVSGSLPGDGSLRTDAASTNDGGSGTGGDAGGSSSSGTDGGSSVTEAGMPDASNDASDDADATHTCGDGVVDFLSVPAEQCDDGLAANGQPAGGDGCDATCQIEAPLSCGDGTVDYANGEECDDLNLVANDGCGPQCLVEAAPDCGDGSLDLAQDEECDDGARVGGDGCSPTCQFEVIGQQCGDGNKTGLERCDDDNPNNGDACNPTCNFKNTTSLFVGQQGNAGFADDPGGTGTARFGGSGTLAVDARFLYMADGANARLRRIEIATGAVTTLAGNGTPSAVDNALGSMASFQTMESIATDGVSVWIGDDANCIIREVSLTPPHSVTTVAGDGSCDGHKDDIGTAARFKGLRGLTYWNGLVYLLNPNGPTLRAFDPVSKQVTTLAGVLDSFGVADGAGVGGTAPFGTFTSPRYMAHDNSGVLYIADTNGVKIRSYNTVTNQLGTFSGDGVCGYLDGVGAGAQIRRPRGMTSDGTSLYWVEFNDNTIRQGVLASQQVSTMIGTACNSMGTCLPLDSCAPGYTEGVGAAAALGRPFDIVFHFPSGSLFFSDGANAVVRRIH